MSLGRFFQEFEPVILRALDQPFRSPSYLPRTVTRRSPFDDPFFTRASSVRPAVDVHEEGNNYLVEAELPGVPRENINVSLSEGGHSLTIEGSVTTHRNEIPASIEAVPTGTSVEKPAETAATKEVAKKAEAGPVSTQLTSERTFVGNTAFTRTVWLPTPVDSRHVSAKLTDGILSVTLNKVSDQSVKVNVE